MKQTIADSQNLSAEIDRIGSDKEAMTHQSGDLRAALNDIQRQINHLQEEIASKTQLKTRNLEETVLQQQRVKHLTALQEGKAKPKFSVSLQILVHVVPMLVMKSELSWLFLRIFVLVEANVSQTNLILPCPTS